MVEGTWEKGSVRQLNTFVMLSAYRQLSMEPEDKYEAAFLCLLNLLQILGIHNLSLSSRIEDLPIQKWGGFNEKKIKEVKIYKDVNIRKNSLGFVTFIHFIHMWVLYMKVSKRKHCKMCILVCNVYFNGCIVQSLQHLFLLSKDRK